MNRKLQEPLTLGKHSDLQIEINDMMIAIKLHHVECEEKHTKEDMWKHAQSKFKCPTWEDVIELLYKSHREMEGCRYNPIKY